MLLVSFLFVAVINPYFFNFKIFVLNTSELCMGDLNSMICQYSKILIILSLKSSRDQSLLQKERKREVILK